MEYAKVKSVGKVVKTKGPDLDKRILSTMRTISDIVGGTLGPGGQPVLIERYEHGLPPYITKDGVTVFRSLGFKDPVAHCIMESSRDVATRTGSEAGDGTTTATILAEAIVRYEKEFCKENPRISPQRVMRQLQATFRDYIEPTIRFLTKKADFDTEEGRKLLHAVARTSANGDTALADAVMECFEITGDEGNVTIVETNGSSGYSVEKIDGFSIQMGYEESCAKFYPSFINDPGTQRVVMQKPIFLLYHGRITEIQTIQMLMQQVGSAWQTNNGSHNVVICATGFSESVLGSLAANFQNDETINVFPLLVPQTIQTNGAYEFLADLQAITGARILDPLSVPIDQAKLIDLGPGVEGFECSRFRSTVLGYADETLLTTRIDELNTLLQNPESELDRNLLQLRKAKLAGGIAKLKVVGASNGELKEKRDRAEDAVCAVRGAIKYGVLPGGAWTLLNLVCYLPEDKHHVNSDVLAPALVEPFRRLLQNSGIVDESEAEDIERPITQSVYGGSPVVFDFLEMKHVDPYEAGVLDSCPAVLEAVRNAVSMSTVLGTTAGVVVFERDEQLERSEAQDTARWVRDANSNPADERP